MPKTIIHKTSVIKNHESSTHIEPYVTSTLLAQANSQLVILCTAQQQQNFQYLHIEIWHGHGVCIWTPSYTAGCSIWSVCSANVTYNKRRVIYINTSYKSLRDWFKSTVSFKIYEIKLNGCFDSDPNHPPPCLFSITEHDDGGFFKRTWNLQHIIKQFPETVLIRKTIASNNLYVFQAPF